MGRGNNLINSGEGGVSKIARNGLIDISLACSVEKSYALETLGFVPEVFPPKSNPQNAVRPQLGSS